LPCRRRGTGPRGPAPSVIPDERLATEREPKRVDHDRELRQDTIPFAHPERVDVRGSLGGKRGDDRLSSRPLTDAEEAVPAPPAECQHVSVVATSDVIEVRVGTGDRPLDPLVITVPAERVQRVRVEANRHPRFGGGDDRAGQSVDADVAVVGELRGEPGGHPLEQGPAGVGGERAPADPARCRRLKVRLAAEKAVGARDAAGREGERVPHGQAVEPVVVPPVTHLEPRWSGPHQGAGEPRRDRPSDRQVVQAGFPGERTEP
jgi:hypothetical protein